MSSTTDFIMELVRAANEVYALTEFERVRLIERAAATIQAQRDLLALNDKIIPLTRDVTADLEKLMQEAPNLPEVLCSVVMLKCADEIRRLRILLKADYAELKLRS